MMFRSGVAMDGRDNPCQRDGALGASRQKSFWFILKTVIFYLTIMNWEIITKYTGSVRLITQPYCATRHFCRYATISP
jgi:hypothetical protein